MGSYLGPQPVPPSLFEKTLMRWGIISEAVKFISHFKDPHENQNLDAVTYQAGQMFDQAKHYKESDNDEVLGDPVADPVARITGALTRKHPNPGPIRKMWFLYGSEEERENSKDVLKRIEEENPGVKIVFYQKEQIIPKKDMGEFYDLNPEKTRSLF